MKSFTRFIPINKEHIEQVETDLQATLSEEQLNNFTEFVEPYEKLGMQQLDNIFLVVEVTIKGKGHVENIAAECTVDQEDWWRYDDEPDMKIDPVDIPLKLLTPQAPLDISEEQTFIAVLEAEENIWDLCKGLPEWIWNEGKFEFMLSFNITTEDGEIHYGSEDSDQYASVLIEF